MKTKEINGSLFLIDEDAEINTNDYVYIEKSNNIRKVNINDTKEPEKWIVVGESNAILRSTCVKIIAQQFIEGKTDYIVDTLFEIESTSTDEEIEVEFVMEYYPPVIGGGLIINNEIGRKGLTRYEGCLKPKTHTKEINNKEYKCFTIKYK